MNRSRLCETLETRGFKVVKDLQSSTDSSIYCVQDASSQSDEVFAAKVVSLSGLDAKGRAAAQQEVSLLKNLAAHPNLIAYRESFVEDSAGLLFIVMSLAEDGDLRRVVVSAEAAKTVLPQPVVLSWFRQTLCGLDHLHEQGVVHRDLKSANVFLCEDHRRIRIGDFGISRVLESTAHATSCVGTPAYMAPELMRNEKYDYHVDMWAMGCIGYELVTLRMPFAADSLLGLVFQVTDSEPDWTRWGDASEELLDVVRRLLSKDTAGRPTASELLRGAFFCTGGAGARLPPEEAWQRLPREGDGRKGLATPDKTHMSQMTTADNGSAVQSSEGGSGAWTLESVNSLDQLGRVR